MVQVRPFPGESLSSYVARSVTALGTNTQDLLLSLDIAGQAKADLELRVQPYVLDVLSRRLGPTPNELRALTLAGFEGVVFADAWKPRVEWLEQVGPHRQSRDNFGQELCPECLLESDVPYFSQNLAAEVPACLPQA